MSASRFPRERFLYMTSQYLIMATSSTWLVNSDWGKKHYNAGVSDGKADGEADGERESILLVLEARKLTVTKEQLAQIQSCTDID
jgi:hypothetical protein